MKTRRTRLLLRMGCALVVLTLLLSACQPLRRFSGGSPAMPSLPGSSGGESTAAEAQAAARAFLDAWQRDDYAGLYNTITQVSRDALDLETLEATYRDVAVNLSLQKVDYEILSALAGTQSAQVSYRITYHTALLGDIRRTMVMRLVLDQGEWRVQWEAGLIMPELTGGNRLSTEYRVPARGNIYDRSGKAIAAHADAVALGVEPAKLKKEQEQDLLAVLSRLTGRTPESIQELYYESKADYVPVGETPAQEVRNLYDTISALAGLVTTPYSARYYFDGGIAPQITGYVLSISEEELEEYRRAGYRGDEKVGAAGLEEWGESYLTGKRGASVYVVSPENKIVTRLQESSAQPAQYIYTTIERDLQSQAQKAIEGFRGAIVVLERDTGRILALVSSPGFDPNLFEPTNANSAYLLGEMLTDGEQRLLNRATQGTYPLGSVSKIITMAAALESGEFSAGSSYNCGYEFTELGGGQTLYDWTYTAGINPSGLLTLPEGLMLSCNPWFWHIGLTLFRQGRGEVLTDMARAFGLGALTGIEQVAESAGSFPMPDNDGDAVQLAIGQGPMLVTPLQVAAFVAAVGNGGTLYRPQIIEKIASPDGDASIAFKPIVTRRLPVSPANLLTIQEAMRSVVDDPRGTARNVFTGLQIPVYGKTGTAQNPGTLPHAWFAGYTDASRSDRPDIAMVVLAENAGEGSVVAAPIFRRVVEVYFSGKPIRLYPWESSFYVVPTAVPTPTITPSITPTAAPTAKPTQTPLPTVSATP